MTAACEKAARRFRDFGCRVDEVSPGWPSPREAFLGVFCGGIAARLAPYMAERRADVDPGLVDIVDGAMTWNPNRYVQAWFDRLAWADHPRRLFEKYDLLLTPTVACPPFTVGLDNPTEIAGTPVAPYDWIPYTFPFNMTGQPGASVPCGFTADRLPIGLQIVGRRFQDALVLRAAAAFEQAQPWAQHTPPATH